MRHVVDKLVLAMRENVKLSKDCTIKPTIDSKLLNACIAFASH